VATLVQDTRRTGNSAKKIADPSPGPWMAWKTRARHARAIRFIETYCRAPKGYNAGKPIRLAPFQKEWLEEVLAPGVHAAVESMPRGNGKSTFKAAVGCWAGFDPGESGDPQVPIISTTIKQGSKTIYGPLVRMIETEPELANRCKIYTALSDSKVVIPFTGGEIFPIAEDPDGLQGLDPSLGMVDEIGFLSVESWASLLLATGKRPDSLIIAIGTPGFDEDNALWHIRQRALEGERQVHYTEYAADAGCDIRDRTQWRKSNPAFVAGFKGEHAFEIALSLPEPLFRIFQLGQWVAGVGCWLGDDGRRVWDGLEDPWVFVSGAPTWVAVDMSRTRDSTAVVAVQRRPDGRLHPKARIWRPQDALGGVIDGQAVMNHLRELDRTYRLEAVAYDPRFFEERAGILEAERLPMVEFPQSLERMTPACGETYELISRGGLSHDGDGEYRKQILNAVPKLNERGFTLKKVSPDSPNRIDATVATCMAVYLANRQKPARAGVCVV
jgi:phage terminase large subunit-like protein